MALNIKWVGAAQGNYGTGRAGKKINKIVVHWIVGRLSASDSVFLNPSKGTSAHYAIGGSQIHQYVKEQDTAYHAGNLLANQESIGIEHEGGWLENGIRVKPSDETHRTSAQLIAEIAKRHNIPLDREHILPHSKFKATQCPGTLDIDRIIQMARDINSPSPTQPVGDQSKYDFGEGFGTIELQAARSIMQAQKNEISNLRNKMIQARNILAV